MKLTRIVHLFLIGLICLSLLLIPSCAKQEDNDNRAAKKEKDNLSKSSIHGGGVYRYPLMNNPSTLDPAYTQDIYGICVIHQMFACLVKFDRNLMVLPALAETWKVEDNGKAYRFVLRENARFHSGQPIIAEDVVFSISRLLRVEPPPVIVPHLLKILGAKDYRDHKSERVKGLEAINDRAFRVQLEEPHAPFLTALGMYHAAIVPQKEVIRLGDQFSQKPIGSGPFRFVSWEKNRLIQLERFSEFYAGESLLDEIHYVIYPGGKIEDVLADFKAGKLEEMPVYGKIRQELSTNNELNWFHRPSLSLLFYGIRGNHPILESPDARKALSMAIDREKLAKEIYKGQFEPARTIIPPGMPGYHREKVPLVEDINKARELIKIALEKDVGSIQPIEIVSAIQSSFAKAELNFIRESWTQLGIPVNIKFITDWKQFSAYRKSDAVQIYRAAWFADMPDPDSFLYPLFASDSPVNYMRYQNEEVDRLLQTARGIIDPVKRAEMYQQIEGIILESSPVIPLIYLSVDRVYQPYVQDIQVSALGAHTIPLNRIWLKKSSTQQ